MSKLIVAGLVVVALAAVALSFASARRASGLTFFAEPPEERAARLAKHWQLFRPEGPGPHPAAILMSGCDGVRDNMRFWAEEFVRTGRAALIVDSHAPRGFDRLELWRLVCTGQVLPGAERAGDIAVALQALSSMDGVAGDVVILGASHGGWAAMEFVARVSSGETPPGLTRWPAPPSALAGRVSGLVLLYPYCGFLNRAGGELWRGAPPTLMILAEEDSIVSTPDCLSRAEKLREAGATVEITVLPGADHGFDQREKSALSTLKFDAAQRDLARERVRAFLAQHAP